MFIPKRHAEETILTRWTVDEAAWREFAANVHRYTDRRRAPACVLKSLDQPAPHGLEVVVREDAIFVGAEWLSIEFSECQDPLLREEWLEFLCDNDYSAPHFFPIPVPPAAKPNAVWVVNHFRRRLMERSGRMAEADNAPTISNRLRKVVEAHFILMLLLFFFVVLPGAAVLVAYLYSLFTAKPL
jgi:hypothetical protein